MRAVRGLALVLVTSVVLAGCFTGPRAHFAEPAGSVDDPAIAAVIAKLETLPTGAFTATYEILTKFGDVTTQASVSSNGLSESSVTIGSVRFIFQASGAQTCQLSTGTCTPTTDDALVSDKSLTHEFYAVSPAARMRQDALVATAVAIASTATYGAQTATCVQIDFTGGNLKKYCALDNGLLAFQDTPDLRITLLSIAPSADPSLFTTTSSIVAGG